MRFAVRTSASVATAVALGCFLTGCQAVQYGVGSNFKNIKMDQMSSAMTFFQGKRNETFPERFTIVS